MKKGKLVFEYTRNDGTCQNESVIISFKKSDSNDAEWSYGHLTSFGCSAFDIAAGIAADLYYEVKYLSQDLKHRHGIANTIKVTEFKVS